MKDNKQSTHSDGVTPVKHTNCPTCRKQVAWLETEIYRPFCSRKCQLIDFGEWATERHSIPADTRPDLDDAANEE
ncbi:MAG: DNA gyrase inhibitor YacG [Pseudomonadota bacterium]